MQPEIWSLTLIKDPPQCNVFGVWCTLSFVRLRLDEVSWDDHLIYDGGSGIGGRGTGCHFVNHNVISGFIISRWLLFRHWCRADQSAKLSNWRWQSDRCLMSCSKYFSHFTPCSCDNMNVSIIVTKKHYQLPWQWPMAIKDVCLHEISFLI